MWQTTRCNKACRDRDHLSHQDPPGCAPDANLYPHTHLYHRDDKGQCFPTACWGRNAEIPRLVATSAYQKPTVCTLQEGWDHSCLDWKEGKEQLKYMPEYTTLPMNSPGQRWYQDWIRPKTIIKGPGPEPKDAGAHPSGVQ